jgi:hypothetical protein
LPNINWHKDPKCACAIMLPTIVMSSDESLIVDGMLGANLCQMNCVMNSNGKLLNLIFTNDYDNVCILGRYMCFKIKNMNEKYRI